MLLKWQWCRNQSEVSLMVNGFQFITPQQQRHGALYSMKCKNKVPLYDLLLEMLDAHCLHRPATPAQSWLQAERESSTAASNIIICSGGGGGVRLWPAPAQDPEAAWRARAEPPQARASCSTEGPARLHPHPMSWSPRCGGCSYQRMKEVWEWKNKQLGNYL